MTDKEIAKDILIKMLETNIFQFGMKNSNNSPTEFLAANNENVQTVCNAFKQIYQAVLDSKPHNEV